MSKKTLRVTHIGRKVIVSIRSDNRGVMFYENVTNASRSRIDDLSASPDYKTELLVLPHRISAFITKGE